MERLVKGDIVVVLFPFSDLTKMKRRPALVHRSKPLNGFKVIFRYDKECDIDSGSS